MSNIRNISTSYKPATLESRVTGDYLTSKVESTFLCRTIEKYYASQGCHSVRAWVEEEQDEKTGFTRYFIRSNLKFDCKTIS